MRSIPRPTIANVSLAGDWSMASIFGGRLPRFLAAQTPKSIRDKDVARAVFQVRRISEVAEQASVRMGWTKGTDRRRRIQRPRAVRPREQRGEYLRSDKGRNGTCLEEFGGSAE